VAKQYCAKGVMLLMSNKEKNNTEEKIDSKHIKIFRERLGNLRDQNDDTQDIIAEKLDVVRQTVFRYEKFNSKSLPDIDKLCILCDRFNVSPNYLLGYSNVMSDNIPNCGLSVETINHLYQNPNIHSFLNYFVEQMVMGNFETVISDIGTTNNVENAMGRVFPKKVINAINKAFDNMTQTAKFSFDICEDKMEFALQKEIPFQVYETILESFDINAKGFILEHAPNFWELDEKERYNAFIKALCNIFFKVKSAQLIREVTRQNVENEILSIIKGYVKKFKVEE